MDRFIEFLKEGAPDTVYNLRNIINTINDTDEYMFADIMYSDLYEKYSIAVTYKDKPRKVYCYLYYEHVSFHDKRGSSDDEYSKYDILPHSMSIIKPNFKYERIYFIKEDVNE